MKIAISGGTGFLGSAISKEARAQGHEILVLTRSPGSAPAAPGVQAVEWKPGATLPPHDILLNLAGETIASRWNDAVKSRIMESRRDGTRRLVDAIRALTPDDRPRVLVNASAVGYYAERGEEELTEDSAPGDGFLADVCKAWEEEAMRAAELGLRVARVRIGVVLGKGGGAMEKMVPVFKMGVGGPLGSGKQWFPWIHKDDVTGIFLHAAEDDGVTGPLNGVSPGIVRGTEFARQLGRALSRPAVIPVPMFALRALQGEFAEHLVESQHVIPRATLASGYTFRFPEISAALREIVGGEQKAAA